MGFYGAYAENKRCFINKDDYSVKTLEPLHKMMEGATTSNFDDRITINQCIELLELQLKISTEQYENYDNLVFEEIIRKHHIFGLPDEVSFLKYQSINQILKEMKKHVELDILYEGNEFIFHFFNFSIMNLDNKVYNIIDENGRNLLLQIDKITITDHYISIYTLKLERQDEYQSFTISNKGTFMGISNKLAIYDEYKITCRPLKKLVLSI